MIGQTFLRADGGRVKHFATALAALSSALLRAVSAPWRSMQMRSRWSAADEALCGAFEQSPEGGLIVDPQSLRIIAANAVFRRNAGLAAGELKALTLPQLFANDDEPDALVGRLSNPDPRIPVRIKQSSRNGQQTNTEITGYRIELGKRRVLAYIARDITLSSKLEARLLEKQQHLDHLAHHDQLTDLPNRLYLAAHLPYTLEDARRTSRMVAILFLDLDRFKHINDSRGHETGDELLKAVSQRLREATRSEDMIVRMGGDEFIVVMKDLQKFELVNETTERITEALSSPFDVNGRQLETTVSIGVSVFPRDGADMGELLRHSDTAMYQAKDRGRNNCQVFNPTMDRRLKQRIAIEAHLRTALHTGQLDVHYQPIIDIGTQKVVALESLLRWEHPTLGPVSPARFISIAEETGLILPIGEFVLERVLQDAKRWRQMGCTLLPIALNVSAVQLQRSNFPKIVLDATRRHGFEPRQLQLELTESAIFERREDRNGEANQDAVAHLRDMGVRIAIDDFGTGYSSLSYLKRWRVDCLKIDRSFVRDLVADLSDLAIVGAIIAMARHLGIPTIAEGIESWQQLEKLRELGCTQAQGHLFAKATPAAQCVQYLSGTPINLANRERRRDNLETTGRFATPDVMSDSADASLAIAEFMGKAGAG
jgi:diguanylate cyclase (GGDEF)-like protein/PAS domain S-box-containing protein